MVIYRRRRVDCFRRHGVGAVFLAAGLLSIGGGARAADESPPELIPPQVQSSVEHGLEWLAGHQDPATGAWPTNAGGGGAASAVTSLSAMAFMARGHVPGQGVYGENINRAVDYVLSIQRTDGILSAADVGETMYDHGISTVMLCEAYGMLDDRRQQLAAKAIARAVRVILVAQAVRKDSDMQGGWRYQPSATDSDISVSGWQLMALRGAANVGAAVPPRAIEMGIEYIKRRAITGGRDRGGFSYASAGDASAARTGTGILALELLGQHQTREALAGGDFLRRNPINANNTAFYFYTVYYCARRRGNWGATIGRTLIGRCGIVWFSGKRWTARGRLGIRGRTRAGMHMRRRWRSLR